MNWRDLGDVSYDTWKRVITDAGGPIELASLAAYGAAMPHTALVLAMAGEECKWGTTEKLNKLANKNVLNLKQPLQPDGTREPGFMAFPTWATGIAAAVERITSPTYGGGVYKDTVTVADLVNVFAPRSENDVDAYVEFVESHVRAWETEPTVPTEPNPPGGGDPVAYTGPVMPVHWSPVPTTNANHPERLLLPGNLIVVWHENGNPGSLAQSESNFLLGGGGPERVSYHFAVDHLGAYQMFALNQLCFHAADGCDNPATDRGCFRGIAIEHCQSHDAAKWAATKRNGAILTAMIIGGHPSIHFGGREGDFSADRIETHRAVSDTKKWCPEFMLNENAIPSQIALVKSFLKSSTPTPTDPKYTTPSLPSWFNDVLNSPFPENQDFNGTTLLACKKRLQVKKATVQRATSGTKAPFSGPDLKAGVNVDIVGVFKSGSTKYVLAAGDAKTGIAKGARIKMADLDELISITER